MSRTCDNFSYVLNTCNRLLGVKNLTFKTGGVDGCACAEILSLIEQGLIDTTPLITHWYSLDDIEEAYRVFESRAEGVIKIAVPSINGVSPGIISF